MKRFLLLMLILIFASSSFLLSANAEISLSDEQILQHAQALKGSQYTAGYCLEWLATKFWQDLGAPYSSDCCAYMHAQSRIVSTSRDNIPIGANVYFSGSDVSHNGHNCGHIGVYVGDGNILSLVHYSSDPVGVAYGRINSIGQWNSWGYPFIGWGYPDGVNLIGAGPIATNLEFRDVVYPKTFKIDTRYGWYLQGGMIVSNVNLTSIRSIIRRVSDGKDIDDTGDIGISGKSYAIKSIDSRVRFSLIDTAGKYAWILIAKDSAGKELRIVMKFEAVTSGTTSTEKRSILNGISDSWTDEDNDGIITPPSSPVYGDTSGSTTFWVRADKANASFVLKSYQGKASVAQHNFLGIPTGDGDEIHYGFYWVSDSTGRSFHWGPDATANKSQLNTNQEISMTFPNPGVYSVTIVPLAYSDVNHYWVMDTINYWKTQAKWIVKSDSLSGCKVSFEKLKEVTISFDAGNGVPSGKLPKGQPFDLGGIVKASENIKSVTGTIYDENTGKAVSGIGTNPITIYPNSTSVNIYSSNINYSLIFDRLNDGVYRYELVVTTVSGMTKTVANSTFTIGNGGSPILPDVPSGGIPGDADGNGRFDVDDVILMLNHYMGSSAPIVSANCDLNGDGVSCGVEDVIAALNMYLGN